MQPGFFVSGDATMMQAIQSASDWRFKADGAAMDNIGQVTLKAGYALTQTTDVYTGVSHLSFADFGEDRGYNSLIIGLQSRKQW